MKPFDLKAALRGEKVVTRDGREVTTVLQPDGLAEPYTVAAVLNGALYSYTESGVYEVGDRYEIGDRFTQHDLFMAAKTVTMFSNIYRDALGAAYTGALHATAADAEKNAVVMPSETHIAVATVTWEE
jgi:hypothetical protein